MIVAGSTVHAESLVAHLWASEGVCVAVLDERAQVIDANGAFERLAGRPLHGTAFEALLVPAQRPAFRSLIAAATQRPSSARLGLRATERAVAADYVVSLSRSESDLLVFAEPLVSDVVSLNAELLSLNQELFRLESELRRRERDLEQHNAELREADHLKDEFISLVSHEFRTPLTSTRGYLHLLAGRSGLFTDKERTYLRMLERNTHRLIRLVEDLLFVAEADAGQTELARDSVDAAALLRECIAAVRPLADGKQLTIELQVRKRCVIAGDHARLAQLFDNLLTNAVKFTPTRGAVRVEAQYAPGGVTVDVSDTGIGIPLDEQPVVFDRFFRSSRSRRRAIPGSGLGLAVAKSIVVAHGGSISVHSAEGAGTTFRVVLPSASPSGGGSGSRSHGPSR